MRADVAVGSTASFSQCPRGVRLSPNSGAEAASFVPIASQLLLTAPQRFARLFDHLVGAGEQCRRDFKAERFGCLEVDDQGGQAQQSQLVGADWIRRELDRPQKSPVFRGILVGFENSANIVSFESGVSSQPIEIADETR